MRRETPSNTGKHCSVSITRPFCDPMPFTGFIVAETGSHVFVTSLNNRVGEWFPLSSTCTKVHINAN